ncbi:zinc-binding dehydrogenase [Streptomyces sp. IB201691-2A2]|uniref:zinc-binding dehydrogenase n=1 Tax=Streptomyces sp. IB201691-2A2 TaxID=2561920 RepID=UPI0021B108D3|nr:zinc-binding dehydrogenase [Streptomyces sp. IB201691-2A2]
MSFGFLLAGELGAAIASAGEQPLPAVADGRVRPLIDSTFFFDTADEAAAWLRSHQAGGKIVLSVPFSWRAENSAWAMDASGWGAVSFPGSTRSATGVERAQGWTASPPSPRVAGSTPPCVDRTAGGTSRRPGRSTSRT